MKASFHFPNIPPVVAVIALVGFLLLSFVMGAYIAHITAPKYSHISYYVLVETEKQENFTLYLPLPDLSPKETEDLLHNFQPTSEGEFKNFSPFIEIGYNTSKISVIESEQGRMLKLSANGSVFLYSNIQAQYEAATVFTSSKTAHIFSNRTDAHSNLTLKFFVFKKTAKDGFFNYNYNDVEFCTLSPLHPHDTERFTYLSDLNFMHESGAVSLQNGWSEYPMYNGSFDICID